MSFRFEIFSRSLLAGVKSQRLSQLLADESVLELKWSSTCEFCAASLEAEIELEFEMTGRGNEEQDNGC